VVLSQAQVNGSFFTDVGLKLAVENALSRLELAPMALAPQSQSHQPLPSPALPPAEATVLARR
jgi:hypothetical protein